MRASTRERMVQEVADWRHAALIDEDTASLLDARYGGEHSMGSVLLRWLGFFALFLLGSSLLGTIGLALGELAEFLAPFAVAALGLALWWQGVRFATDPQQRFAISGSVLITAAMVAAFGSLLLFYHLLSGDLDRDLIPWLMGLIAAASLATGYRYGLRWPLAFGLLLGFHALGSWHAYAGHGGYFLGIRDERLTLMAGSAVAAFGLWHEDRLEHDAARHLGFGRLYLTLGLLYANLSVWFLSLHPGGLEWVLAFTALGIAQLIAGAALHDGRITGFGVVFLAIDFYTRYYEHFWDSLSKGGFFLLAGLSALALGAIFERQRRQGGAA